jgi:hypothetical protein
MNIQEIQAKIDQLGTYSLEAFSRCKVRELRNLAKGIVANYTNYNKTDLIHELMAVSEESRKALALQADQKRIEAQEALLRQQEEALKLSVAQLATPEATEARKVFRVGLTNQSRAEEIFRAIETAVRATGNLQDLKDALVPLAIQQVSIENSCYAPKTIKSNKTEIKKALDILVEAQQGSKVYHDLKAGTEFFKATYERSLSHYTVQINESYKESVVDKVANQVEIDPSALLEHAENVLGNLEKQRYEDVVIAVGIATGRRMAEIMASGTFEAVDEYTLRFTGIAKARMNQNKASEVIMIPSLVPASLVVQAITWLANYRLDDLSKVNQKYAKPLSRALNNTWLSLAGDAPAGFFTFKSLRALYVLIAYERSGKSQDINLFFAKVLGHEPTDLNTANSYKIWRLS